MLYCDFDVARVDRYCGGVAWGYRRDHACAEDVRELCMRQGLPGLARGREYVSVPIIINMATRDMSAIHPEHQEPARLWAYTNKRNKHYTCQIRMFTGRNDVKPE